MPQIVIDKWGDTLAIRFPGDIVKSAGLDVGQAVEVLATTDAIIIRKLPPKQAAETLFGGRSPAAWRELYAEAYDWGPDRGRERIEA